MKYFENHHIFAPLISGPDLRYNYKHKTQFDEIMNEFAILEAGWLVRRQWIDYRMQWLKLRLLGRIKTQWTGMAGLEV